MKAKSPCNITEKLQKIEDGELRGEGPKRSYPEDIALYGGISGPELAVDNFALCDGCTITKTYSHIMSHYIMAFNKPKKPSAPHPAPWKSARGGFSFDINSQLFLREGCRPTTFDRLNTLWLITALLRLKTNEAIRMPIVSDVSFIDIPSCSNEPNLWPIEMYNINNRTRSKVNKKIEVEHLLWVKKYMTNASIMSETVEFNRAFQIYDSLRWFIMIGPSIVAAWAAMETIFKPSGNGIARQLSKSISAFLTNKRSDRDRMFQTVRDLYTERSSSVHACKSPDYNTYEATLSIARAVLLQCIENCSMPDAKLLQDAWKE